MTEASVDRAFIVGCGDIGSRLARRLVAEHRQVAALCRTAARAAELRDQGVHPVIGDLDDVLSLRTPATAGACLFYLAPPQPEGDNDLRIRAFLGALNARAPRPTRIVLVSTTAVYGDCGGGWVDERSVPQPSAPRGRRRLDAEHVARAYGRTHGTAVVTLRVAGIYSADRLPVHRLRRGDPVVHAEQSPYTNRIHAQDLVRVLDAAARRGQADAVYNVADDEPMRMTHYFFRVAEALGLPHPPTVTLAQAAARVSPAMLSYLKESRRVSNRKMRRELGVELEFPNLQAGLHALKF